LFLNDFIIFGHSIAAYLKSFHQYFIFCSAFPTTIFMGKK